MLRLLVYIALFLIAIYILFQLKKGWDRLSPNSKKQIVSFGLYGLFNILKLKWRIILSVLLKLFKK